MPRCFGTSGFVRASRIAKSHRCAFDVHTFCPLTTNSSPSRSARVARFARSLPAPRLAEQLAPRLVGAQQRPQVARPLRVGAVAQEHRTDHADRRRDEARAHRERAPAPGRRSPPAPASPPRPPYSAGQAMPAQPPSNSSRCQARPASKCSRSVAAASSRARIAGACAASQAARLGPERVVGGHRAHPNILLDTCKVRVRIASCSTIPTTFADGFPHDDVPRAARRRSRLASRSPDVEARLLGRSPATPTCSASPATRRRSATRRIRSSTRSMAEDGDARWRSCSSARTRRCTRSCAS